MWRSLMILTCLVSTAAADKGGIDCQKDEAATEKLVRSLDCETAARLAEQCARGAGEAIKLTTIANDTCRADFAKSPEVVKEYDALAARCETKLAKSSKKEFDARLNVLGCKLRASQLMRMLK